MLNFFFCLLYMIAFSQNGTSLREVNNFRITGQASIVYDINGSALDSIAAHLLAKDIEQVTGLKLPVLTQLDGNGNDVILIGNIQSALIKNYNSAETRAYKELDGQWEKFLLQVVPIASNRAGSKALLIAGSDDRGTAFGVFEISKRIGVSPWYWWADVPVVKNENLTIEGLPYISAAPSVKYRGIFINDEDWGLQPWAAKTFEPSTGDIGPNTYAKVFELLLRLKANLVWPAMHPSTKAFFYYPGNVAMAKAYQIVVGTSHAEPMLRNNVDEWNTKTLGEFNYQTNKQQVLNYWDQRVKESKGLEAIFTLGMRGIHDSGMEGVKSLKEAAGVLDTVISDQRGLLEAHLDKQAAQIPQAFTLYKEVLDVYDEGLQLAEDITMVWPDDNYGYIKRLSNPAERRRPGGAGVYYHASYWGRPHDYLWLSTTHPALMRHEMMKAYAMDAKQIWVLNVGDIKPHEYNIQLFLDMAYRAALFEDSRNTRQHFNTWHQEIFGKQIGDKLANTMWQYYQLAFERRPEFMGWSQTEPTRPIAQTAYQHDAWGDEAQKRLNDYALLENELNKMKKGIDTTLFPAFYQLAYYPVRSASLINQKFLYRDKALLYANEQRIAAMEYKQKSHKAYREIVEETEFFNRHLSVGKWNHMMDMAPRSLPVFKDPDIDIPSQTQINQPEKVGFSVEQSVLNRDSVTLPVFNTWVKEPHFFDLFLKTPTTAEWRATTSANWIKLSKKAGILQADEGLSEQRIWVETDWKKVKRGVRTAEGTITVNTAGKTFSIKVIAENRPMPLVGNSFVESNHLVVMYAEHFTNKADSHNRWWTEESGLGHTGTVMKATIIEDSVLPDSTPVDLPFMSYEFNTIHESHNTEVILTAMPTHPLTDEYKVRIGVAIDQGPMQILDFKTEGRSETWKQNVLQNKAIQKHMAGHLVPGKHTLKIYMVDPGVLLDYIYINLGGYRQAVSVLQETRQGNDMAKKR